jgi:hypothetical protein
MVYEIAKRCAVGHKLADQLRSDTCSGASMDGVMTADAVSTSRTYTTKLGTKAKMKTARPVPAGFTS